MIFGILVDIYERTSETKYGPAMTSSYGETEAGKSASTRFSVQTPDLQSTITFYFFIGINIIPTLYNRQERILKVLFSGRNRGGTFRWIYSTFKNINEKKIK